ncbi:MAG TPA: hypothetical protein VKF38_12485 [Anaerolineaceae bacterium]|nr:hypothetical protein [Anaerolineaceae bacterium]
MIISSPEITLKDGEVIVSANIKFNKPALYKPENAWFAFPESYLPYISGRADAFAASFLPLAMAVKEDLHIEGPLSPRLACGLQEYQLALNFWYPKQLALVDIQAATLTVLPPEQAGQSCVSLFSGGVDSSYTLMTHLPDRQPNPDFQVRYALFVKGFDIPLQNRADYTASLKIFSEQLRPLGVEVIPCRTNLHYFSSGLLNWGIAHGGTIISTGLVLDKLIRYFLVPSSYALVSLTHWGSSPMIDHWLSTETLQALHDGTPIARVDKVTAISTWHPAQQFLRVCVDDSQRYGVNNCSKCEKCLRTMIVLEICGTLKSFKTFQQPFGLWDIIRWVPPYDSLVWFPQMLQCARVRGKTEYIFPIWFANLRGKLWNWLRKMIPKPLFNYLKKRNFPYQKDLFNPANMDGNL